MASPYDHIPEDILRDASGEEPKAAEPPKPDAPTSPENGKKEHRQIGPFKKRRAGVVLSREQVKEIKQGRKKLRRDMRQRGIRSKQEFELVAGSLGLYFDKGSGLLAWLLHGRALWALLGALLLLLLVFFIMSLISKMRGYFTINLSDDLFRVGFVLSETEDFRNPQVNLYAEPAADVPCVSITWLDEDLDAIDGQHNKDYFAYTFYCRNEGDIAVDYSWELEINDEYRDLSEAVWAMVFEDGDMIFYAKPNSLTGQPDALPAFGDDSRGYIQTPFIDQALYPDEQYQVITSRGDLTYYRLIPRPFEEDLLVTHGVQMNVEPQEVHKYTVVLWIEGDDIDADDSKIGGHLGLDMQFRLLDEVEEEETEEPTGWFGRLWSRLTQRPAGDGETPGFWQRLRFWE